MTRREFPERVTVGRAGLITKSIRSRDSLSSMGEDVGTSGWQAFQYCLHTPRGRTGSSSPEKNYRVRR